MKILIPSVALILIFGYGCATKKPMASNPSVTNIGAAGPAETYGPGPVPQPVASEPLVTQTPSGAGYSPVASGGASTSTYTVKKGDTLFRIAKDHYGEGKQWQRIAAANPGVSPQSLRVGQTLNMP